MAKKHSDRKQSKAELDREIQQASGRGRGFLGISSLQNILSGSKKVTYRDILLAQKPLIWQIIAYLKLSKGTNSSQKDEAAKKKSKTRSNFLKSCHILFLMTKEFQTR